MKFTFRGRELDLQRRPAVCGILNVTPDSFSDGGSFLSPETAVARAVVMQEEGADMIDVGAESTRPGAQPVPAEDEIKRLIPVVKALKKRLSLPVSVDTFKPETARAALDEGADIINDITGLREDNGMAELVSEHEAGIIIMHMQGTPQTMQINPDYKNVKDEVTDFLRKQSDKAVSMGISRLSIALDPGIGFGKNTRHNLHLINSIGDLKLLGYPVFVGISRKSVIGDVLNAPVDERLEGTAALTACSVMRGADIIRVHDPGFMKKVALMARAVAESGKETSGSDKA